ncbi:hypothetical protein [Dictyobacter arantiisoli]|uniref:Uncharacterized protein n=1 Tax=Dictyobacter arantiisoli TaxID=2014874 RepID=A0A5A5T9C1_9CHLR|nr:hypothetical protein [Dictyobacter arantiisoli]GCF08090.1 hypothetical protein KDI_16540 [Dictyobacter arantiisoli]
MTFHYIVSVWPDGCPDPNVYPPKLVVALEVRVSTNEAPTVQSLVQMVLSSYDIPVAKVVRVVDSAGAVAHVWNPLNTSTF